MDITVPIYHPDSGHKNASATAFREVVEEYKTVMNNINSQEEKESTEVKFTLQDLEDLALLLSPPKYKQTVSVLINLLKKE